MAGLVFQDFKVEHKRIITGATDTSLIYFDMYHPCHKFYRGSQRHSNGDHFDSPLSGVLDSTKNLRKDRKDYHQVSSIP